jgi:hypothetical protein
MVMFYTLFFAAALVQACLISNNLIIIDFNVQTEKAAG